MSTGFLSICIDHQQYFTIAAFDFGLALFISEFVVPGGSRHLSFFHYQLTLTSVGHTSDHFVVVPESLLLISQMRGLNELYIRGYDARPTGTPKLWGIPRSFCPQNFQL